MNKQAMSCQHPRKLVVDGWNNDMEVYYECLDCGAGWRQKPETEEDAEAADAITAIDVEAVRNGLEDEI